MSERARLPNRRAAELIDFEHNGRPWTLTVGRFGDGRIAEVFLDTPKASAIGEIAADAAIVASLALQSGCHLETLRHALAGRNAGPLGAALGLVNPFAGYAQWLILAASGFGIASEVSAGLLASCFLLWIMGTLYNVRPLRLKDIPYLDEIGRAHV